jgi:hypothetical protein
MLRVVDLLAPVRAAILQGDLTKDELAFAHGALLSLSDIAGRKAGVLPEKSHVGPEA